MSTRPTAGLRALMRSAIARIVGLIDRRTLDNRLDEELRLHLDMQADAFQRQGMGPAEARRAARIAFGAAERFKDEARDAFRSRIGAELSQDVRYALRASRKAPLVTAVALATLALTIGIATSAFSAVSAVLLRALPYPDPDRLALVWGTTRAGDIRVPVSFTNAADWRRDLRSFEELAVFSCTPRPALTGRGPVDRVAAMMVSAGFFAVLRTHPMLGRGFDSTDFAKGSEPVVVLGNPLWRNRFASDAAIVGRRIVLDGVASTVIGVLPRDFHDLPTSLGCRPDLFRPVDVRYDDAQRSWRFLKAIGRLRKGVSMARAQSELDAETVRLAAAYPASNAGQGGRVVSLAEDVMRPIRPALLMVQAGALLLLLIACANIANLLLARAAARRREFAVRIALGASRARLMRQVAVECAMLALIGGGLGLLLATAGADAIARAGSGILPDVVSLRPDLRVVTFVVAATFTAALVLAFGPVVWAGALAASGARDRDGLLVALRDGGRGTTATQSGLRRALVTAQVGLALVALVDGGLLAGSYRRLQAVPPGFDARGVLTAQVALPDVKYPRGERQVAFFLALTNELARQPGVTAVGAVSILPESPNFDQTNFRVLGRVYGPGETPDADVYRVTPGYFAALDIPIVAGRRLTAADDERHPPVAVINATMAQSLFGDSAAVGRRIWTGAGNTERTIVGVVGDVYQYGLDSKRTMQLYVPHADNSGGQLTVAIRTADDPVARGLVPALGATVRALDPDVPLDNVMTLSQVLAASAARRQFLARVSLGLAAGALLLAAIGLYGVMAYATVQRTGEFGIRMALGASSREIAGLVARDGLALALRGLLVGLVISRLTAPWITTLLFGLTAADAVTYLASPAILLCVALLSCVLPALRAARLSPVAALRAE